MKIALTSDVHLEFGPMEIKNEENADVLILSGDIYVANDRFRMNLRNNIIKLEDDVVYKFFDEVSSQFKKTIYVMGNHEHYQGDFAKSEELIRNELNRYSNIFLLEKESMEIDDVLFFGATFWTDMDNGNPIAMMEIREVMNDYNTIKNSNNLVSFRDQEGKFQERIGKLVPEDTLVDHKEALKKLKEVLANNKNKDIVVVGHHAPSKLSTHPHHKDSLTNAAYSTDLSDIMLDNPNIKLWTHGHTHDDYDYTIGSTRVVCNPRGYIGYQERAFDHRLKYIDL